MLFSSPIAVPDLDVPVGVKNHVKRLLPPANEVWDKVICLQVCVCPRGGVWSGRVPGPGGGLVPGVPGPGGGLVRGEGVWSGRGLCLVETPPNGYCCGRYASYWNAFLFIFNVFLARYSVRYFSCQC